MRGVCSGHALRRACIRGIGVQEGMHSGYRGSGGCTTSQLRCRPGVHVQAVGSGLETRVQVQAEGSGAGRGFRCRPGVQVQAGGSGAGWGFRFHGIRSQVQSTRAGSEQGGPPGCTRRSGPRHQQRQTAGSKIQDVHVRSRIQDASSPGSARQGPSSSSSSACPTFQGWIQDP